MPYLHSAKHKNTSAMSKRLLCLLVTTSIALSSFAQCTISSITTPGIYPDTTINLPAATAGTAYGTDIQVVVFEDTVAAGVTVIVSDITINSVVGLPAGFSYNCNPTNCVFPGGGNGCIWLSGNPTAAQVGTYNLTVNVTLHGVVGGFIPVSQASTVNGYKIIINPAPAPTPDFSSPDVRVCATQSVTFNNTSTGGATSYLWTFPGGTPATSTAASPTVQYLVKGSYDVTLQATNANGSNTITKPAFVLIDSLSVAAVVPGGNNNICSGQSIVLSSQSTHPSFTYQWEKNNANIPNATGATFSATQQGTYRVKVTNGLGCTKRSANNTVFVSSPMAPVAASGPTTFCSGGSVLLQTAGSLTNTFQWLKNNVAVSGANAPIFSATSWGNYRVRVTDANGCSNTSAVIPVIVNPNPNVTINASGPLAFCAGQSVTFSVPSQPNVNYQWQSTTGTLTGGNSYTATTADKYWVTAVNTSTFCQNTSSKKTVVVNCRLADNQTSDISARFFTNVYPNPASNQSNLYFELPENRMVIVQMFDMTGRKVISLFNGELEAGAHEISIDAGSYPAGVYFVRVDAVKEKQVIKLIIDHQ